jgi:hypothetical protein
MVCRGMGPGPSYPKDRHRIGKEYKEIIERNTQCNPHGLHRMLQKTSYGESQNKILRQRGAPSKVRTFATPSVTFYEDAILTCYCLISEYS